MDLSPVLVTGFEPYGGRNSNPAHDVMRALAGRRIAAATIIGRALPVSFTPLRASIDSLLDEIAPSAVIALGLSPGEAVIRIERIGVNIADFDMADNEGTLLKDREVELGGFTARFSSLPVREIERDLLAEGIPARLSMTAGTFVCNACLYAFLDAIERKSLSIPCGFLHLPYTPDQVSEMLSSTLAGQQVQHHQRTDLASMDVSRMIRAVEIAIAATLRVEASKRAVDRP